MIWIVSAVLNTLRSRKSLPGKNLWNGKRFLFTLLTAFNAFLHLIIAVLAIIFEFYCNSDRTSGVPRHGLLGMAGDRRFALYDFISGFDGVSASLDNGDQTLDFASPGLIVE